MQNKKILVMGIVSVLLIIILSLFEFPSPIFSQSINTETVQSNQITDIDTADTEIKETEVTAAKESLPAYFNPNGEILNNVDFDTTVINEETLRLNQEIALTGSYEAAGESSSEEITAEYSDVIYGNIGDISSENAPIGISKADPFVNIRELPDTNSSIVGKLYKDSAAAILSYKGDWVQIESGTVKGFIKSEFLNLELSNEDIIEKYGKRKVLVATDGLNVRKEAEEDSKRLTVVYSNEVYPVLDETDDWIKISIEDDNITGYIVKEYVNLIVNYNQAISLEEEQALLRLEEEKVKETDTSGITSSKVKKSASTSASSPKQNYSDENLKLLACLVHAESGNQPYEGKLAVANVVLNRVRSSSYPNSIKSVVYQPGQFSVTASGSLQKQLDHYDSYSTTSQKLSIDAARSALEGHNNIGNALYFNRYSANREDSVSDSKRIEDHLFW